MAGHVGVTTLLLQHGATALPRQRLFGMRSTLERTLNAGHINTARVLLRHFKGGSDASDAREQALQLASEKGIGSLAIVALLAREGVVVHAPRGECR